jgi:hypothetical protein
MNYSFVKGQQRPGKVTKDHPLGNIKKFTDPDTTAVLPTFLRNITYDFRFSRRPV